MRFFLFVEVASTLWKIIAVTRDRTRDLQIFSLTLSQLSYCGAHVGTGKDAAYRTGSEICFKDRETPCISAFLKAYGRMAEWSKALALGASP